MKPTPASRGSRTRLEGSRESSTHTPNKSRLCKVSCSSSRWLTKVQLPLHKMLSRGAPHRCAPLLKWLRKAGPNSKGGRLSQLSRKFRVQGCRSSSPKALCPHSVPFSRGRNSIATLRIPCLRAGFRNSVLSAPSYMVRTAPPRCRRWVPSFPAWSQ